MKHIPERDPDSVQHFYAWDWSMVFFRDKKHSVQIFYTHVWKIHVLNSLPFAGNLLRVVFCVQPDHLHSKKNRMYQMKKRDKTRTLTFCPRGIHQRTPQKNFPWSLSHQCGWLCMALILKSTTMKRWSLFQRQRRIPPENFRAFALGKVAMGMGDGVWDPSCLGTQRVVGSFRLATKRGEAVEEVVAFCCCFFCWSVLKTRKLKRSWVIFV